MEQRLIEYNLFGELRQSSLFEKSEYCNRVETNNSGLSARILDIEKNIGEEDIQGGTKKALNFL
jgi:hypothetical protein